MLKSSINWKFILLIYFATVRNCQSWYYFYCIVHCDMQMLQLTNFNFVRKLQKIQISLYEEALQPPSHIVNPPINEVKSIYHSSVSHWFNWFTHSKDNWGIYSVCCNKWRYLKVFIFITPVHYLQSLSLIPGCKILITSV